MKRSPEMGGMNFERQPEPAREKSHSLKREIVLSTKEKLFSMIKYRILKSKEYFKKLNQEEFNELLSLDFQDHLRENPPIKEVFSPEEELVKIRNLPKDQKRETLRIFKERLASQRKAWGQCRVFIERSIEFNHDVSKDKLISLVNQFGSQYGFTEKQKQMAEQLIDGYFGNRQKALDMKQQYPNDSILINQLTGVNLGRNEDVRVSVGPMSIDIDANGFNSGRLYEGSEKPVINFKYGGFASQGTGKNSAYYVVINQDRWIRWTGYLDSSGNETRKHEYEHQKNKLFRAVFEHQFDEEKSDNLWQHYQTEQDPAIKKTALEEYFRFEREDALEQAKNEIAASLYDRSLSKLRSQLNNFFFKQGGPFDYLTYLRNFESEKENALFQETSQRIIVQEYKAIIEKAVESFTKLVKKGKYSKQEAIALLTDKSLSDWPKTIRRLLEQK